MLIEIRLTVNYQEFTVKSKSVCSEGTWGATAAVRLFLKKNSLRPQLQPHKQGVLRECSKPEPEPKANAVWAWRPV